MTRHFPITLPHDFANAQTIEIIVPPAPISIVVHRVEDDFARYADNG